MLVPKYESSEPGKMEIISNRFIYFIPKDTDFKFM